MTANFIATCPIVSTNGLLTLAVIVVGISSYY
jgi:hypothetical protein